MNLPERLGKYLLVARIAVGGMAEVFKARTAGLGGFEKVLAVKRLHSKYSKDVDFIKMLIDEAKIAVQLAHSNVCQIFDLDRLGEHYFICMEFIDGRDLHRVLRRTMASKRLMPIDVACFVAKEVLAGLDYAHRKVAGDGTPMHIIHRDISPQNILVSWEGEVKIVDFGIAKAARRAYETESGIIKGKFYYMSPEHARGGDLDRRSDIFSLGIVLYESLTGDSLYSGVSDTQETLLSRVRNAKVAPPSKKRREIPNRLDRIVMKALAKNPDERYQSAAAFADAIGSFLHQHYPRMGRPALSAFMRDHLTVNTDESEAARMDPHTIMSKIDFMVDQSSLIFDPAAGPTELDAGNAAPVNTRKVSAMPNNHTFDDDPFFNDGGSGKLPADGSDVYELADDDIDIIPHEEDDLLGESNLSAEAQQHPLDTEPTMVRRVDVQDGLAAEAILPDDVDDSLDEEPTQIYKPQAVLANSPDADHGPLRGEARLEITGHEDQHDDEATVITSLEDVYERRPSAPHLTPPPPVAESVRPVYLPQQRKGMSPGLLVVLFVLVLVLGAALAVGGQLFLNRSGEETTEISAPTVTEAEPEVPQVASYAITSLPEGARVLIDGEFQGLTPTTIAGLEVGSAHVLRLEYDGHRTQEQALSPGSAGEQSVAFTLDRLLGTIQVTTVPENANILIDGVYRDRSPATIEGLDTRSSYILSASLPGHLTANEQIVWTSENDDSLKNLHLELTAMALPEPELAVNAITNTAPVVAPDRPAATNTTRTSSRRSSNDDDEETPTRTSARRSSSDDEETSTRTSSRRRSNDDEDEETSTRTSARRSSSDDEETPTRTSARRSSSDDEDEAEETTSARRSARRGSSDDNEESATSRSEDDDDDDSGEADMGRLSIRAEPEGQVFIDGRVVATSTPLLDHELSPGTHTVKVYFVADRQFSPERRVRVEAGETRSVFFRQR